MTIKEYRIPLGETNATITCDVGVTQMLQAKIPLRVKDEKGRYLKHTLVHCEVFDEAVPEAGRTDLAPDTVEIVQYALSDCRIGTMFNFGLANILASETLPSIVWDAILFKETGIIHRNAQSVPTYTLVERFPEDSLFTTPTLSSYSDTWWFSAMYLSEGNPQTYKDINLTMYVVVEESPCDPIEWQLGWLQWSRNRQHDMESMSNRLDNAEQYYPYFMPFFARGGSRPEFTIDSAIAVLHKEESEPMSTPSGWRSVYAASNTMIDPTRAFGSDGFPDWIIEHKGLSAPMRADFPPISYDTTTTVKIMV